MGGDGENIGVLSMGGDRDREIFFGIQEWGAQTVRNSAVVDKIGNAVEGAAKAAGVSVGYEEGDDGENIGVSSRWDLFAINCVNCFGSIVRGVVIFLFQFL
jgi:hypothetical protein